MFARGLQNSYTLKHSYIRARWLQYQSWPGNSYKSRERALRANEIYIVASSPYKDELVNDTKTR